MKLDRVTITGADNSIDPRRLGELSNEFPFVEWGILVSRSHAGKARFPSQDWMVSLQALLPEYPAMSLSLHLCGAVLRELLIGQLPIPELFKGFRRVQLNFHGEPIKYDLDAFMACVALDDLADREFIFQIDGGEGQEFLAAVHGEGAAFSHVPLFDMSHGAGVVPKYWPSPFDERDYTGYAGGLGDDNLAKQIPLIATAAGDARIWIDMETKVRSDFDRQFNLGFVRKCLEVSKPFVAPLVLTP